MESLISFGAFVITIFQSLKKFTFVWCENDEFQNCSTTSETSLVSPYESLTETYDKRYWKLISNTKNSLLS